MSAVTNDEIALDEIYSIIETIGNLAKIIIE